MPLPKCPVPQLINSIRWEQIASLGQALQKQPARRFPGFLTDLAIHGYAQTAQSCQLDPTFHDITEALHTLADYLGAEGYETEENLDTTMNGSTNDDTARFETPHIDAGGSLTLLLTLFQESGSNGRPWTLRTWPSFRKPVKIDIDKNGAEVPAADLDGIAYNDFTMPAGSLVAIGGRALQSAGLDSTIPHALLRPPYYGDLRVVRKRLMVFDFC